MNMIELFIFKTDYFATTVNGATGGMRKKVQYNNIMAT